MIRADSESDGSIDDCNSRRLVQTAGVFPIPSPHVPVHDEGRASVHRSTADIGADSRFPAVPPGSVLHGSGNCGTGSAGPPQPTLPPHPCHDDAVSVGRRQVPLKSGGLPASECSPSKATCSDTGPSPQPHAPWQKLKEMVAVPSSVRHSARSGCPQAAATPAGPQSDGASLGLCSTAASTLAPFWSRPEGSFTEPGRPSSAAGSGMLAPPAAGLVKDGAWGTAVPAAGDGQRRGPLPWQPHLDALQCALTGVPFSGDRRSGAFPMLLSCGHAVAARALKPPGVVPRVCPVCGDFLRGTFAMEEHHLLSAILDRAILACLPWCKQAIEMAYNAKPQYAALRDLVAHGSRATVHACADPAVVVKRYNMSSSTRAQRSLAVWNVVVSVVVGQVAPQCLPRTLWWQYDSRALQLCQERHTWSLHDLVTCQLEQGATSTDMILMVGFKLASALHVLHTLPSNALPPVVGTGGDVWRQKRSITSVIHGSVQPQNVLVDEATLDVVLCGLSHATLLLDDGSAVLPPEPADESPFAPPEAVCEGDGGGSEGEEEGEGGGGGAHRCPCLSDKADVWGVAITMLFMATGRQPYEGMRISKRIRAQAQGKAPYKVATSVHPELDDVLHRCLHKDAAARPSMAALKSRLATLVANLLQTELRRAREKARREVEALEERTRQLEATLQVERARVEKLRTRGTLPVGIGIDLSSLCAYSLHVMRDALAAADDDSDSESSRVLDLGQRHVSTGQEQSGGSEARLFELACGLRGGVLHLRPRDVLRVSAALFADVRVVGCNAGAATPVLVLRAPRLRAERLQVSQCSVRVVAVGAHLLRCTVRDCDSAPAYHVGVPSDKAIGEDEHLTLEECEAQDSYLGLLVAGFPGPVFVRGGRYLRSKEHNIRVRKDGSMHSAVDMFGVLVEGAGRTGAFVESLCHLRAEQCAFDRNGHYGVQTMPKAEVMLRECGLRDNVRGELSGHNILVVPPAGEDG